MLLCVGDRLVRMIQANQLLAAPFPAQSQPWPGFGERPFKVRAWCSDELSFWDLGCTPLSPPEQASVSPLEMERRVPLPEQGYKGLRTLTAM